MKYIDEFRNRKLVATIAARLKIAAKDRPINIMEVCGTHTQSFFRFGLKEFLPANVRLISGPGCPVCVSSQDYIEQAIKLAGDNRNIILTFGDMLRVPGKKLSLEGARSRGGQVHMVYSPADSLEFARKYPDKNIIFLAVGFETTAPAIGLTIMNAKKLKLKNLSFLCALKTIPTAMAALLDNKKVKLDGFLCPGHVSAIIGVKAYEPLAKKYKIPCCVAGFEPLDMMEGLLMLVEAVVNKKSLVTNQYTRVVTPRGNLAAQKVISQVFQASDAYWRGLGNIPQSGLRIRKEFSVFDAEKVFALYQLPITNYQLRGCKCGSVLSGIITPEECPLFGKVCTLDNPVGPCMVSYEGSCNAHYKYAWRRS